MKYIFRSLATEGALFTYFVPFVIRVLCVEVKVDLLPDYAGCLVSAQIVVHCAPYVIPDN